MKPRELQALLKRRRRSKEDPTGRAMVWKRGQGRCWYCGAGVTEESFLIEIQSPLTKDSKGKKLKRVIGCGGCAQLKGTMGVEEFRALIQIRLKTKKPVVFFGEWNYFLRKQKPPIDGYVIESGLPALVRI